MTTDLRLSQFRHDLTLRDVPELVQRHVTYGSCFALGDAEYFELKKTVATQFSVHTSNVVVVGSAKMGFSVVPTKRYRAFGETSDIDVVLCSTDLYDAHWQDVFDYWARGEQWSSLADFRKYHFRGWMRPDMLPPEKSFVRAQEWWEFFRTITASGKFGPYKIAGALYKNWHFLERYQERCMADCKALESGSA
jgi:hypothetical protein